MNRVARPLACLTGVLLLFVFCTTRAFAAEDRCDARQTAVQILGSGGPLAGASRASAGYLVWRGGRAVVMVDAGGGTFLRFGEAGARLSDLSLLAISHLHPDHVADLPALLWLSEISRQTPLRVAGPSAGGPFPDFATFLARLFDPTGGAFAVSSGTLGGPGNGVRLEATVLDVSAQAPTEVLSEGDLKVTAVGVPHGTVPAVAYRVQLGGRSVVFGTDQNGLDPRFVPFAQDADVLVLHLVLSTKAPEALTRLHATPARVGEMARDARARRLVLSHISDAPPGTAAHDGFSSFQLDRNVAEVKTRFAGPVTVATDLQCVSLP